jgi:hypothetical protein
MIHPFSIKPDIVGRLVGKYMNSQSGDCREEFDYWVAFPGARQWYNGTNSDAQQQQQQVQQQQPKQPPPPQPAASTPIPSNQIQTVLTLNTIENVPSGESGKNVTVEGKLSKADDGKQFGAG